jgi:FKBP-type peptidyl-prolyl cis-trans isomerase SlyD
MTISENAVVLIDYTLQINGELVDSSDGEPLAYLQGHGNIVEGLENALLGKKVGDKVKVKVAPAEGYGEYDEEAQQMLPLDSFDDDIEIGHTYQGEDEDGNIVEFLVVDRTDDGILVDFNHPLAGETLDFEVTVREVRVATDEELEHGHPHGEDDYEHN